MLLAATIAAGAAISRVAEPFDPPRHLPRAPLSDGEAALAARILRAETSLPPEVRIAEVRLRERPAAFTHGRPSDPADREAVVVALDPTLGATYEAVVALSEGYVRSFRRIQARPRA